jgi:MFS superfamily sulfate permease-like transporter
MNIKHALGRDLQAGFQVFLLALPLSVGISLASGFPAGAGLLTAIVGGLFATWLTDSRIGIKGPAAGLIVIVLACVEEMRGIVGPDLAYQYALAAVILGGIFQVILSLVRGGVLADFFPSAVVHGMLAAIGVTIFSKQIYVFMGVDAPDGKNPLELLKLLPENIHRLNPQVLLIGLVSLSVLLFFKKIPGLKKIPVPAALVAVLAGIGLGIYFDVESTHILVSVPDSIERVITFPVFEAFKMPVIWKHAMFFFAVGSLESLLSAKAVDLLDPTGHRTRLDKDLFSVGAGNIVSGFVGGLPMITEIVRSSANLSFRAETRRSNFFHGLIMLTFLIAFPTLLHRIPLASLSALLIVTGYRLASPKAFQKTLAIGREQLVIFLTTLIVTLATDLLVGVAAGFMMKLVFHWVFGLSLRDMFSPLITVYNDSETKTWTVDVKRSLVFTHIVSLKPKLEAIPIPADGKQKLRIDLSEAEIVDHSILSFLQEYKVEAEKKGMQVELIGLDRHTPSSSHPLATRSRIRKDV